MKPQIFIPGELYLVSAKNNGYLWYSHPEDLEEYLIQKSVDKQIGMYVCFSKQDEKYPDEIFHCFLMVGYGIVYVCEIWHQMEPLK